MIKAAHGGGGKGMRIVRAQRRVRRRRWKAASAKRSNAFGRDRVLLERYVERPRHIEIQVFADTHGHAIHLNERECSAQRRYQKVLEESPSPFLTPELRDAMGEAAVRPRARSTTSTPARSSSSSDQDGGFYFMEINTRLQVEHPVTEMVTGLDLVEWQLRVAAGEPLPLAQDADRASTATRSKCACTPKIPKPVSCPAPAGSNACACRRPTRTCASTRAWSKATRSRSSTTR